MSRTQWVVIVLCVVAIICGIKYKTTTSMIEKGKVAIAEFTTPSLPPQPSAEATSNLVETTPTLIVKRRQEIEEAKEMLIVEHNGVECWFPLIADHPVIDRQGNQLDDLVFTKDLPVSVKLQSFINPDLNSEIRYRQNKLVQVSQPVSQATWKSGVKRDDILEGFVQVNFIDLDNELTSEQARNMFLRADQRWLESDIGLEPDQVRVSGRPTPIGVYFRDVGESVKITVPSNDRSLLEKLAFRMCSTAPFVESLITTDDRDGRPCIWVSPAQGARLDPSSSAEVRTTGGTFIIEVTFLPAGQEP